MLVVCRLVIFDGQSPGRVKSESTQFSLTGPEEMKMNASRQERPLTALLPELRVMSRVTLAPIPPPL